MIKTKSQKKTVVFFVIGLFLFSCLWAAPAFAEGNLTWGKIKGKVGLKYELEYNDNIFSEKTNEENDFIHFVIPAIELGYQNEARPGNYFFIGYSVALVDYSDFEDNNYEKHAPYVNLGLKSPMGLYFTLSDNYMNTADPYGASNQYGLGSKTKRFDNTADALLGYEFFKRYAIEGFYRHYLIRYDLIEDKWQDRTDNRFGGNLVYNVTPKTGLFFQYRHTMAEYDEQNSGVYDYDRSATWSLSTSQDYTLNDYFVGARFNPDGKLSGEIKVGYGTKDFENDYDIDGNKYEDIGDWIAETQVSWQIRERTLLSLEMRRSHEGSPDADATSYIDTTFGLMWEQDLAGRLSFNAGGEWKIYDYQNEPTGTSQKEFNEYTGKIGVKYNINKWLLAGLRYEFRSKNATDSAYAHQEYDRNQVVFTIGGEY